MFSTTLLFGFTFLDLLIKFMKMTHCNVTTRAILILGHSTYTDLPLSPTHPAFLLAGAAAHYPRPTFLLAGAAAKHGSICGHVFVRWRERGGPGITSLHVGWQRAERILVLVILGSLESKLKRLGLDIFFNFLTLKTF